MLQPSLTACLLVLLLLLCLGIALPGFHDITTQNAASESLFDTDGSVQEYKLAALSRTYATAIAGMPGTIAMYLSPAQLPCCALRCTE